MTEENQEDESSPQASSDSTSPQSEPEAKPYDPGKPDPQLMISLEERSLQLPIPERYIEKDDKKEKV